MISIEDKLRELGIDPEWHLCDEVEEQLDCAQCGVPCPVYGPRIGCHGSIIARLIDMVEGMRRCESCKFVWHAHREPPGFPGDRCADYSNWRYWGLP